MGEILSLQSLEPQAVYSMDDEQKHSYNIRLFEFFAHLSLRRPEDAQLCKFATDALDFLNIEEVKGLSTFRKVYSQIETLFALLYRQMKALALPDSAKLEDHWVRLH
jgi:hypothetical protein